MGVGETVGYRLSKIVGVRVPEMRLSTDKDAWEQFAQNMNEVCSAELPVYIKRIHGGYALSKRLVRALPLYFIDEKYRNTPTEFLPLENLSREWVLDGVGAPKPPRNIARQKFIQAALNKPCPLSRSYYKDFTSKDEHRPEVIAAANWRCPDKLLIHAYRAFLFCTFAHLGQVLTDQDGRLHVIDFEKCIAPIEGDNDIERLGTILQCNKSVFDICRTISRITETDLKEALANLDVAFWQRAVCTSEEQALDYLGDRLDRWKRQFPPQAEDRT